MKFLGEIIFVSFILVLLSPFLFSVEDKVISTVNGVDLLQANKYRPDGVHFASDLYLINHNSFPVEVSIKLSQSANIKNGLIDETFVIESDKKGYFGWLSQEKKGQEGSWNVEWYVNKHEMTNNTQSRKE